MSTNQTDVSSVDTAYSYVRKHKDDGSLEVVKFDCPKLTIAFNEAQRHADLSRDNNESYAEKLEGWIKVLKSAVKTTQYPDFAELQRTLTEIMDLNGRHSECLFHHDTTRQAALGGITLTHVAQKIGEIYYPHVQ